MGVPRGHSFSLPKSRVRLQPTVLQPVWLPECYWWWAGAGGEAGRGVRSGLDEEPIGRVL